MCERAIILDRCPVAQFIFHRTQFDLYFAINIGVVGTGIDIIYNLKIEIMINIKSLRLYSCKILKLISIFVIVF